MTIENKTHCWSDRQISKIIPAGIAALKNEKTTNNNKSTDLGVSIAILQKYYSGDQSRWYTMPAYQLIEYAEAIEKIEDGKAGTNSVEQGEFAGFAHNMGMTGVYDAIG